MEMEGMEGGSISQIATNGDNVIAFGAALFHSTDRGMTWQPPVNLPRGTFFRSWTRSGSDILVGSNAPGIDRTTDGGRTWSQLAAPLLANERSLILHNHRGVLLAGASFTGSGIFRSTDGGVTFVQASDGLLRANNRYGPVSAFATVDSTLLVASGPNLYRSTNDGASWTVVESAGSVDGAQLAAQGNLVFVLAKNAVRRSVNGGQTWTTVDGIDVSGNNPPAITFHRGVFYVSTPNDGKIRASRDSGTTWELAIDGMSAPRIDAMASDGRTLFAGTLGAGMYRREDDAPWRQSNSGMRGVSVRDVTRAGTDLVAATANGLFRLGNGGERWQSIMPGPTSTYLASIDISGSNWYAAGAFGASASSDAGATWATLTEPDGEYPSSLLAVGDKLLLSGSKVHHSTDRGQTWITVDALPERSYRLMRHEQSLIAAQDISVIYQSTDEGATWTRISNGLPMEYLYALHSAGGRLFAGVANRLYVTSNNGATWQMLKSGPQYSYFMSVAVAGNAIFASVLGEGLLRSTDDGATWSGTEGWPSASVSDHMFVDGGFLYAGSRGHGVLRMPLPTSSVATDDRTTIPFSVRPNISNDLVTVRITTHDESEVALTVVDAMGRAVLAPIPARGGSHCAIQVDLSSLPAGLYFVSMKGSGTRSAVIKR